MMKRYLSLGLLLICMSSQIDALTKPSSIKFESNAYTGIIVAIHRDIPESQELIDRIEVSSELTLLVFGTGVITARLLGHLLLCEESSFLL